MRSMIKYILAFLLIPWATTSIDAQYVDLLWERLAHYPFSNGAEDISGQGNNGIVHEAVPAENYREETGYSYYFDGVNDYIDCGNGLSAPLTTVSVCCWIRTDQGYGETHLISKVDIASGAGFILGTQEGKVKWAGFDGSGQFNKLISASRIDDNRWHCLVGMVEGDTWSLYVDGTMENHVITDHGVTALTTSTPLTIGCYFMGNNGDHQYFRGTIDEVMIQGRALNECELEVVHTGEPYPPR
jgi:hypothetical protein